MKYSDHIKAFKRIAAENFGFHDLTDETAGKLIGFFPEWLICNLNRLGYDHDANLNAIFMVLPEQVLGRKMPYHKTARDRFWDDFIYRVLNL